MTEFLERELAPHAPEADGVGREHYAIASRYFVGAEIDLDETYEWGLEELARMVEEQERIADQILPGATVAEAIQHLDADPAHKLHGTDGAAGVDAGDQRPRRRRPRAYALRHPRADATPRVHDRADAGGRHLLHAAERGLRARGPYVVERARGRHGVRHVARADDGLSRGRAGPSPPVRTRGPQQRRAQRLAPLQLELRSRRGLGPLRRAAHVGPRLSRRSGQPARDARRTAHAGRAGRDRPRRAPRQAQARRHRHVDGRRRRSRSCPSTST